MKNNLIINRFNLMFSLFISLLIFSCKPEKTDPKNDSEVITTLECLVVDTASGFSLPVFRFADPDGDGGMNPTTDDTIRLQANKTYHVSLRFLDETKNPVVDITEEVEEEGEEHQVFFEPSANTGIQVSYRDTDTQGNPIGIATRWVTSANASGTVRIFLKHQPGVKDGNPLSADTDFDHTFNLVVN